MGAAASAAGFPGSALAVQDSRVLEVNVKVAHIARGLVCWLCEIILARLNQSFYFGPANAAGLQEGVSPSTSFKAGRNGNGSALTRASIQFAWL